MSFLDAGLRWLKERQTPLRDQLVVTFDENTVRVLVLRDLDPELNQTFDWANVERVCFVDGGIASSDVVHVMVRDRDRSVSVPLEAAGGSEFFGVLGTRGLFPEAVWRKAIAETGGGVHCWPPFPK